MLSAAMEFPACLILQCTSPQNNRSNVTWNQAIILSERHHNSAFVSDQNDATKGYMEQAGFDPNTEGSVSLTHFPRNMD